MANLIKTMLEDGAAYGVCIDGTRDRSAGGKPARPEPGSGRRHGAHPRRAPLLWLPISRTIEGTFR